jgi:flagellar biosynthesis GTPase FlhF
LSHPKQVFRLIHWKSLWSIPDVNATWPGIRTPVTVAIIVGIITYLIVFNLEQLLWVCYTTFSIPRDYLASKTRITITDSKKSDTNPAKRGNPAKREKTKEEEKEEKEEEEREKKWKKREKEEKKKEEKEEEEREKKWKKREKEEKKKKQQQQKWLAKATDFEDFPPDNPKTSNWWLPVFAVWLAYDKFRKQRTSEVRNIDGFTVYTNVEM